MTAPWVDKTVDLDAYFARICYRGSREPNLETLQAIIYAHVIHIPFESLDVATAHGVRLDNKSVDDKIIGRGRGGYCFEQNILMSRVLAALGYTVLPISSRIRMHGPAPEYQRARTHVSLVVTLDDVRYLVDVGAGGLASSCAMKLDTNEEQLTSHEPRRIVNEGKVFVVEAKQAGTWVPVNDFTLEPMPPIDRELANWYTSTHPNSVFTNNIMASLALPEGRVSLMGPHLSYRDRLGVKTRELVITSREQLLDILREIFGIRLPDNVAFRPNIQLAATNTSKL